MKKSVIAALASVFVSAGITSCKKESVQPAPSTALMKATVIADKANLGQFDFGGDSTATANTASFSAAAAISAPAIPATKTKKVKIDD